MAGHHEAQIVQRTVAIPVATSIVRLCIEWGKEKDEEDVQEVMISGDVGFWTTTAEVE